MTHWKSGHVERGDVTLAFARTGGAKPPMLLLHGLAASGACWTPVARAFADRFDVIMLDARGHGDSSAPPHGYGYEDHVRDVISVIDGLHLEAPVLVGHSMGGMTAALVASRYPNVARVVLADPTFLTPARQREVYESDVAEQHRRLLRRSRREVEDDLRKRHAHRTAETIAHLADARLRTNVAAFDVLVPPNPAYENIVAAIDVPILLVTGDAGVVTLETARHLSAINLHLRVEVIAGAGHGLHVDRPDAFAAALERFVTFG